MKSKRVWKFVLMSVLIAGISGCAESVSSGESSSHQNGGLVSQIGKNCRVRLRSDIMGVSATGYGYVRDWSEPKATIAGTLVSVDDEWIVLEIADRKLRSVRVTHEHADMLIQEPAGIADFDEVYGKGVGELVIDGMFDTNESADTWWIPRDAVVAISFPVGVIVNTPSPNSAKIE